MKRIVLIAGVMCLIAFQSYTHAEEHNDSSEQGTRYVLYQFQIEDKATPVLLDSQTGKVWVYQQNLTSFGSDKGKFKGVTVEGLSYSLNELGSLEKETKDMRETGTLGEENKAIKAALKGEFSYAIDFNKLKKLEKEARSWVGD